MRSHLQSSVSAATSSLLFLLTSSHVRAEEPCAEVGSALSTANYVPAELAHSCLQSVPVQGRGEKLLQEFRQMWQWQSTLKILADPPENYTSPPYDVLGFLTDIENKWHDSEDGYTSEYEFQMELYKNAMGVHDTHTSYYSDIQITVSWQRSEEIVSLSSNHVALPEIWLVNDIVKASDDTDHFYHISPVSQINGQNVTDFLIGASQWTADGDMDSRYNNLFRSMSGRGGFLAPSLYPGPWTNFTFQNGSTYDSQNYATFNLQSSWDSIADGQSFFDACCTSASSEKRKRSLIELRSETSVVVDDALPVTTPEKAMDINSTRLSAYFIPDSDVAVIRIPTHSTPDDVDDATDAEAFQNGLTAFLEYAQQSGKDKMIIDVRGNGGGNPGLSWDVFKQFFPQREPADVTRYRAHEDFLAMAEGVDLLYLAANSSDENTDYVLEDQPSMIDIIFNYRVTLKEDGSNYTSMGELMGPHTFYDDEFTGLYRRDLSWARSYGQGVPWITGYGPRANVTEQRFESKNIVMLTDGVCGSACAVMAEYLKNAGMVRTIAVGGLPREGPMQGVASTKGGFTFGADVVHLLTNYIIGSLQEIYPEDAERLNQTLGKYMEFGPILQMSTRYNWEDHIQPGDEEQIPLELTYEAADCRIFYTEEMLRNPYVLWKTVARVTWDYGKCVHGSTGHPSSISGGDYSDPESPRAAW